MATGGHDGIYSYRRLPEEEPCAEVRITNARRKHRYQPEETGDDWFVAAYNEVSYDPTDIKWSSSEGTDSDENVETNHHRHYSPKSFTASPGKCGVDRDMRKGGGSFDDGHFDYVVGKGETVDYCCRDPMPQRLLGRMPPITRLAMDDVRHSLPTLRRRNESDSFSIIQSLSTIKSSNVSSFLPSSIKIVDEEWLDSSMGRSNTSNNPEDRFWSSCKLLRRRRKRIKRSDDCTKTTIPDITTGVCGVSSGGRKRSPASASTATCSAPASSPQREKANASEQVKNLVTKCLNIDPASSPQREKVNASEQVKNLVTKFLNIDPVKNLIDTVKRVRDHVEGHNEDNDTDTNINSAVEKLVEHGNTIGNTMDMEKAKCEMNVQNDVAFSKQSQSLPSNNGECPEKKIASNLINQTLEDRRHQEKIVKLDFMETMLKAINENCPKKRLEEANCPENPQLVTGEPDTNDLHRLCKLLDGISIRDDANNDVQIANTVSPSRVFFKGGTIGMSPRSENRDAKERASYNLGDLPRWEGHSPARGNPNWSRQLSTGTNFLQHEMRYHESDSDVMCHPSPGRSVKNSGIPPRDCQGTTFRFGEQRSFPSGFAPTGVSRHANSNPVMVSQTDSSSRRNTSDPSTEPEVFHRLMRPTMSGTIAETQLSRGYSIVDKDLIKTSPTQTDSSSRRNTSDPSTEPEVFHRLMRPTMSGTIAENQLSRGYSIVDKDLIKTSPTLKSQDMEGIKHTARCSDFCMTGVETSSMDGGSPKGLHTSQSSPQRAVRFGQVHSYAMEAGAEGYKRGRGDQPYATVESYQLDGSVGNENDLESTWTPSIMNEVAEEILQHNPLLTGSLSEESRVHSELMMNNEGEVAICHSNDDRSHPVITPTCTEATYEDAKPVDHSVQRSTAECRKQKFEREVGPSVEIKTFTTSMVDGPLQTHNLRQNKEPNYEQVTLEESLINLSDLGAIFCFGGITSNLKLSKDGTANNVLMFNGVNWKRSVAMPEPRYDAAACTFNAKIYVTGGIAPNTSGRESTSTSWCFCPMTAQWSPLPNMLYQRRLHSLVVLDGLIYAIGGEHKDLVLDTVEVFNPKKQDWKVLAALSVPVSGAGASCLDGYIYVCGGVSSFQCGVVKKVTEAVQVYNPKKNMWRSEKPLPTRRGFSDLVCIKNVLYLVGGLESHPHKGNRIVGSILRYDAKLKTWKNFLNLRCRRFRAKTVYKDPFLFIIGGEQQFGGPALNTVETFDFRESNWVSATPLPFSLTGFCCAAVFGEKDVPPRHK